MSTRKFPNWMDAYCDWADDAFTPPQFNEWAALSTIAGALERKTWLPWNDTFAYYPNLYILLVSLPGAGKSTAIAKSTSLLREMNRRENRMHFIPSQITEAEFIETMGVATAFNVGSVVHTQSSGYYFASEASNSLKNVYGDFIACLTDFFDNPQFWEKSTRKDGRKTLKNVSLNLLAGSTFDYLSKLVNDENIMGGFASRLIYVLSSEKKVRVQGFQSGIIDEETKRLRVEYRKALVDDLHAIHKLTGTFSATPEFGRAWEKWYMEFETKRQEEPSEKLQSLLVRTNTNLIKISMLLSVAEADDLVLRENHFHRAWQLLEPITAEIPKIFRNSKALDTKSQVGLNNAIIAAVTRHGTMSEEDLRSLLMGRGFFGKMADDTIERMLKLKQLRVVSVSAQTGQVFEFVGDINSYL